MLRFVEQHGKSYTVAFTVQNIIRVMLRPNNQTKYTTIIYCNINKIKTNHTAVDIRLIYQTSIVMAHVGVLVLQRILTVLCELHGS